MNRRIALSGLSILTTLVMLGGSAFAAFTTTATATGNTFSTTTPNLTLSVNGGTFGTSVTGASVSGLVPGVAGPAQNFTLSNNSTDPSDDLAVTLQFTASASNTLPGSDLTIQVVCPSNGINITQSYNAWISTGGSLGTIVHNSNLACTMTPTLNTGVGNADA